MAACVNGPYLLKAVKGKHCSALHLSWGLEDKMEKIIEKQTEEDLQVLSVEEDSKSRSCIDNRGIPLGQVLSIAMFPILE